MSEDETEPHLTTWCHCWKLERRDGSVTGFTDHDRTLVFDGLRFEPRSGFTQSETRTSLGLAVDAADIEGALSSADLREEDIDAGLLDGARVETWRVDWQDVEKRSLRKSAIISTIRRRDGAFYAELESPLRHLDRPNGRLIKRRCDAELGDARCGVALSPQAHIGEGAVLRSDAPNAFVAAGLSGFEEGWFSYGWLEWTSGAARKGPFAVVNHSLDLSGVVITLADQPMTIAPGWTFRIMAGCDKAFATCRAKFDNHVNFRGFPHLPGNDAAYAYVTEGAVHDGGPLVE